MTDDALEIVAKRPIAKGEQVFAPYGRESIPNSKLLLDYGFAFEGNAGDEVVLQVPEIGQENQDWEDKLSLLKELGLNK